MIVKEAGIRTCRNRSCDTKYHKEYYVIIVQLLSCVGLFMTPWTATIRFLCIPLPPGVCSNTCPLSQWWYLTISSSAAPISFLFQSFPGSQSFPMAFHIRWPKFWSISISLSNEYSGLLSFRFEWLDLLQSKGFSRVFSSTTIQKHQFFGTHLSLQCISHIHIWLPENNSFEYMDLYWQIDVSAL